MTNKEKAAEIYTKHLTLATSDGRLFRKTVMDEIMVALTCSLAASATFYNNCKKAAVPIEGLGRVATVTAIRKPSTNGKKGDVIQADNDCFTVLELLKHKDGTTVARTRSFLMQGDASESFDDRVQYTPSTTWLLIQGLGPLSGESFKLQQGEKEIKRYTPENEPITEKVVNEIEDEEFY